MTRPPGFAGAWWSGGDENPLEARIVALADVFDALTSKRPYKEAWPVEKALDYIHDQSGQHFDPQIVQVLDKELDKVLAVKQQWAE